MTNDTKQPINFSSLLNDKLNNDPLRAQLNARIKSIGTSPIYTDEHNKGIINPLAKVLRKIYMDKNISRTEFDICHKDYCLIKSIMDVSTHKGNKVRNLYDKKLSLKALEELLGIVGLGIDNIKFDLVDQRTGEVNSYNTNEKYDK